MNNQRTQTWTKDIDFTREIHKDMTSRAISKGFRKTEHQRHFYSDSEVRRRKTFTETWTKDNMVVTLNYYTVY